MTGSQSDVRRCYSLGGSIVIDTLMSVTHNAMFHLTFPLRMLWSGCLPLNTGTSVLSTDGHMSGKTVEQGLTYVALSYSFRGKSVWLDNWGNRGYSMCSVYAQRMKVMNEQDADPGSQDDHSTSKHPMSKESGLEL